MYFYLLQVKRWEENWNENNNDVSKQKSKTVFQR